jgi:superfamily II DNA/RNA helicase
MNFTRSCTKGVSRPGAVTSRQTAFLTKMLLDRNADSDHVFMMFSATFPKAARELAVQHMASDYAFVRVGRIGSTHKNITQRVRFGSLT